MLTTALFRRMRTLWIWRNLDSCSTLQTLYETYMMTTANLASSSWYLVVVAVTYLFEQPDAIFTNVLENFLHLFDGSWTPLESYLQAASAECFPPFVVFEHWLWNSWKFFEPLTSFFSAAAFLSVVTTIALQGKTPRGTCVKLSKERQKMQISARRHCSILMFTYTPKYLHIQETQRYKAHILILLYFIPT